MTALLVLNWFEGMVFIADYFRPVVLNTDSTLKNICLGPILEMLNYSEVGLRYYYFFKHKSSFPPFL